VEIKWLHDFLMLHSEGNFRIAAQQRSVSQPAFSRRIKALENWVGAPLFDRSTQPTQLTEAGRIFLPAAQEIVDLAKMGKCEVQTHIREDKERIGFATISSLAQIFIPGWLKTLRPFTDANQFVVRTNFDTIKDYFDVLEDNTLDFFICYENPKHRFFENENIFTSLKLGAEALVPVTSPHADGTPRWWLPDPPREPIPCLHTLSDNSPSPIRHHMETRYRNLSFKSVYDSSSGPTLKAMAIEGFGLAWVPKQHIINDLLAGRLVRSAEPADDIIVDIRIYRCTKYNEPRVAKFWEALLEHKNS
jgi:DNA-binding transcriptional LysR family regulator